MKGCPGRVAYIVNGVDVHSLERRCFRLSFSFTGRSRDVSSYAGVSLALVKVVYLTRQGGYR